LRGINGFTQILLEDYAGKLDDEGRRLCEVIRGNSTKMGQLIDDLLAFSRLHRVEMQYSPVDMKEMVNSLYMEMTDTVSRNRINLTVAELSTVTADPAMISQVWQNLLSNAIKYSSRKENAEIAITSKQEHGKIIYCISDNGAGFDMQYIHKIFGVFQRLHSEKQYEGTGVGLAIVQRIVERHGGNVWAEGEPGNGATFYFSLPVAGAAG
jgi:light-regulated signal transduction histidine kinase (bacteriophytochrome)